MTTTLIRTATGLIPAAALAGTALLMEQLHSQSWPGNFHGAMLAIATAIFATGLCLATWRSELGNRKTAALMAKSACMLALVMAPSMHLVHWATQ